MSTSPGRIERSTPWAAIRLTCAGVKIGNMRSALEESVSGEIGGALSVIGDAPLLVPSGLSIND
jgi:hypothetical protein